MGRSTAERALKRAGTTVDVINYTEDSEDEYGENYSPNLPAEAVPARVVPESQGISMLQDELASSADFDAAIFVADSVTITRDGGGTGATQIDDDQDGTGDYVVIFAHDQGNGLTRLACRRRTEG